MLMEVKAAVVRLEIKARNKEMWCKMRWLLVFSLLFWCKIMFLIWSFAHLEFKWWGRENVCVLWQFGLDLSSQPWFWFIPSGARWCSGYYCGLTSGRSWFQIHRPAETFIDLYVCSLFYSSLLPLLFQGTLPPTVQRHVKLSGSELVIGVTRVLPLKQTSDQVSREHPPSRSTAAEIGSCFLTSTQENGWSGS